MGHLAIVKVLLEHGASADAVDQEGWTPLRVCEEMKTSDGGNFHNQSGLVLENTWKSIQSCLSKAMQ